MTFNFGVLVWVLKVVVVGLVIMLNGRLFGSVFVTDVSTSRFMEYSSFGVASSGDGDELSSDGSSSAGLGWSLLGFI